MFETRDLESLLYIFDIDKKKDLESYCRGHVIYSCDFAALVFAGQAGILEPYRYANFFKDKVPDHLNPSDEEHKAIRNIKTRKLEGKSRKFARKVMQIFKERRYLAAHLFYTPCNTYWHLFYFDQRDHAMRKNHWRHGPHIHFISSLWPILQLDEVWQKVQLGDTNFKSKIHIRFVNTNMAEDA